MEKFIKEVKHQAKEPVRIEREENDVVSIEGVKYAGDYFREFGAPDTDVLYAVMRDSDGVVRLTLVRTAEEAIEFFNEQEDCFAAKNKSAACNDIGDKHAV
jgi:hypothetical protein